MMTSKVPEVGQEGGGPDPEGSPHSESNNQRRLWQSNRQAWAMQEQVTQNIRMVVYGEIGRGLALENAKTYREGRSTPPNATVWCVVCLLAPPIYGVVAEVLWLCHPGVVLPLGYSSFGRRRGIGWRGLVSLFGTR